LLVDHRTYRIKPGCMEKHLDLYEKHGYAAHVRNLGKPLGFLVSESGELNTIVHMWVYEDAADRAKKRAALQADPEWQAYIKLSGDAGYLENQKNSLMMPAKFAPIAR
jgi:hypothetical protein